MSSPQQASPLAAVMPTVARADDVSISVNPGIIALGYRDGYWDRDRHWHEWRNHEDAEWYRNHSAEHFYDREHRGEKEQGWRNEDRWWDHEHR
jgi:hypothetical protein